MDLTSKMVPLIAILASIYFSNTEAYMKMVRNRVPFNLRRSGSDDKGCICFPPAAGNDLIPEILKSQGHKNLKRLVTYFYIDIDTCEAVTYIPDPEKQKLYPDLALGELDTLSKFTSHNFNLFNNIQRDIALTSEESHIADKDEEHNEDSDLESDEDDNENDRTSLVTTEVIPPLSTQTAVPTSTDEAVSDSYDSSITNLGLISSSAIQNAAKKSLPIDGNSVYISSTDSALTTIADNSYHSENLLQNDLSQIIKNYPTFENWYEKQMIKFHPTQSVNLLQINKNKFKETLKGTLANNKIILSDDGILRRLDGSVIDMNKLELRAIWIGEKLSFKDLIVGNHPYINGNTLQTVLVSLVYPPRILGIIPLGRTSLTGAATKLSSSRSSSRNPLKLTSSYDIKPETPLSSESSSLFTSNTQRADIYDALKREPEIAPISLKQIAVNENVSRKPLELIYSHVKKPDNPVNSEASSIVALKAIESSETSNSHNNLSEKSKPDQIEIPVHEKLLRTVIELLKDQNAVDDDDELPGVRIIGGKTAVSSGSLINNKGRSGLNRRW